MGRRFEEGWDVGKLGWRLGRGGGSGMMDQRLDWVGKNRGWEFVLWWGKCAGGGRSGGFREAWRWLLAKKGGHEDLGREVAKEEGMVIEG